MVLLLHNCVSSILESLDWLDQIAKAMSFFFLMPAKMTLCFLLLSDFCSRISLASTNFWDFVDFDIVWLTGTMAVPLLKKQIVKKRVKQFKRPQSDRKICVKVCISGSTNFLFKPVFASIDWMRLNGSVCMAASNAQVISSKLGCISTCLFLWYLHRNGGKSHFLMVRAHEVGN